MKRLICNLKMNFTFRDFQAYKTYLEENLMQKNVILCPAFCYLPIMHSKAYLLGAQDVSSYEEGMHTGEVGAKMLKSIDVSYVLLNHSELKNTLDEGKEKLKQCLKSNLQVGIFISETEEEHFYQYTIDKLLEQIDFYLKDISRENYSLISFIYEPQWLVGSDTPLTPATIKNLFYILKKELRYRYKTEFSLYYGGGVGEKTVLALKDEKMIDGFVLGKSSLDVKNVLNLANHLNRDTIRHN